MSWTIYATPFQQLGASSLRGSVEVRPPRATYLLGAPFLGLVTLVSLWLSRVRGLRVFLTVGLLRSLPIRAFLLSLTRVISMWEFLNGLHFWCLYFGT